jgi:hypothetical protein
MAEGGAVVPGRWLEAFESRPWGWFAGFLALAALLVGAMLAWWALIGFWDTLFDPDEVLGLSYDGRSHLTMTVLLAFVFSGARWVRSGVLREIEQLGAMADVPAAEIQEARRRNTRSPGAVRFGALLGAAGIGVMIIPLTSGLGLDSLVGWDLHHVWAVANNTAIFFLLLDSAWLAVQGWATIHDYTHRHLAIDLLDRSILASLGRTGLRGAVVWLGGGIIASSLSWGMNRVAPLVVILAMILLLATLSLLLPAHMARARLCETKRAELSRVRAKIGRAKEAALAGSSEAREQATLLPGLLAYEARIESVREWPYDTPTLVRFAVLAAIAAVSWLGGALVERLLEAVLG